jgi:hypothetical protein
MDGARFSPRFAPSAGWNAVRSAALGCAIILSSQESLAWVYPEHHDISLLALQQLDAERRRTLDTVWAAARSKHETRLCAIAADAAQAEHPTCIDYAAWPAIAGDHSCSSEEMVKNIVTSDWILDVAHATARLKRRLAEGKGRDGHVNALRDSEHRPAASRS